MKETNAGLCKQLKVHYLWLSNNKITLYHENTEHSFFK